MRIVHQQLKLDGRIATKRIMRKLERIGRLAYKSEDKIKVGSYDAFIRKIIDLGHEAVLEHETITVLVTCDIAIGREWIRHRIAAYLMESTRYCNYLKKKFGSCITVVWPLFLEKKPWLKKPWKEAICHAEQTYLDLIANGATAQEARTVLPLATKAEFYCTFNLRQWRHFFRLRTAPDAHPQMIEVANMALKILKEKLPVIFEDFDLPEEVDK